MNTSHRIQAEFGTQLLPRLPEVATSQFWVIAHNESVMNVSAIFIWMLFVFSLMANIYLLIGLGSLEAPRYMLMKNLILSDVIQSITLAPPMLYCLYSRNTLSFSGHCLAQYFVSAMAIITSLLTVVSMALERYIYTCHAIRYLVVMTNRRLYICVFFIWLIALMGAGTSTVLALRGAVKFGHAMSGFVCEPSVIQAQIEQPLYFASFNKAFIGCLLFFCLLVFSFSYGRMYQVARKVQEPFQQDNVRARGTVAFYVCIFILQFAPSKLISLFGKEINDHLLMSVLVLVPPCVNPLAYGIRNKEVQLALHRLWWVIKKKRSEQQVAVTSNMSTSIV